MNEHDEKLILLVVNNTNDYHVMVDKKDGTITIAKNDGTFIEDLESKVVTRL